ncbi:hypothetical protein FGO68_gene17336 [Halteria grandinella]|uniref:Protein tyrosine phosphatase n=1 Tax=Halteria grandinella TaxID=5974 RepID=A0A8J8T2J4_HALGN|nr:hypothetical protein FGO68_gene17336 [Halteria grandinella]
MRINCHKGQFNNLYKNSSSEFRRKNKYNEILPYLHNQVKLKYSFDTPDDKFQDYYNASFVNSSLVGSRGSKTFIAAMAPTINTVDSLWKLIVEQRISLIIQLCPDEENGKEMCFRYYRSQSEYQSNFTFGGYQMVVKQRIEVRSGLFMTDIQVIEQNGEIVHTVRHLQETLWPDNKPPGVREDCGPSEAFQRLIYTIEVIERNRTVDPSSPVLVHCSAGVGRTGTLISLYTVYEAIKYQRESLRLADPMISIFGVVRRLREQRWNSVRNHAQYRYIYTFIQQWLKLYYQDQSQKQDEQQSQQQMM